MMARVHEVREVRGFLSRSTHAHVYLIVYITDFTDLEAPRGRCQITDFTDYTDLGGTL
jgi:hypothetical protein